MFVQAAVVNNRLPGAVQESRVLDLPEVPTLIDRPVMLCSGIKVSVVEPRATPHDATFISTAVINVCPHRDFTTSQPYMGALSLMQYVLETRILENSV